MAARNTPKKSQPAEYEPNQLFRVRDKHGDEHVVGGAWLNRWPDDFTVIDETSDPESEGGSNQGPGNRSEQEEEK